MREGNQVRDKYEQTSGERCCFASETHDFGEQGYILGHWNDDESTYHLNRPVRVCRRCKGVFAVDSA